MVFIVGPCFQIHSVNLSPFISVCGFLPQKAITDIWSLLLHLPPLVSFLWFSSFSLSPTSYVLWEYFKHSIIACLQSCWVSIGVLFSGVALGFMVYSWEMALSLTITMFFSVLSMATRLSGLLHFHMPLFGLFFILTLVIKLIYETPKDNGRANTLAYTFAFPSVSSSFPLLQTSHNDCHLCFVWLTSLDSL